MRQAAGSRFSRRGRLAEMRQWRKDWYGSSGAGTDGMSDHMDDMHD